MVEKQRNLIKLVNQINEMRNLKVEKRGAIILLLVVIKMIRRNVIKIYYFSNEYLSKLYYKILLRNYSWPGWYPMWEDRYT